MPVLTDKPYPGRPPLTLVQAKALTPNDYVCLLYRRYSGRAHRVAVARVNGWPVVWKRRPDRVRVPWKFGMYDYGAIEQDTLHQYSWCDGNGGWYGSGRVDLDRLAGQRIKEFEHQRRVMKIKKSQRILP